MVREARAWCKAVMCGGKLAYGLLDGAAHPVDPADMPQGDAKLAHTYHEGNARARDVSPESVPGIRKGQFGHVAVASDHEVCLVLCDGDHTIPRAQEKTRSMRGGQLLKRARSNARKCDVAHSFIK